MTQESQIKLELICNLLKKIDERHLDFVLQVVQGEFIPAGENGSLENMRQYARAELTHATQGPASEADAAARLAICMACPDRAVEYKGMKDEGGVGWCTRCGCGSSPRALLWPVKLKMASVECPLGKFKAVPGTGATVASAVDAVAGVAKSIIHKLTGG
jgi:hypothetical protein